MCNDDVIISWLHLGRRFLRGLVCCRRRFSLSSLILLVAIRFIAVCRGVNASEVVIEAETSRHVLLRVQDVTALRLVGLLDHEPYQIKFSYPGWHRLAFTVACHDEMIRESFRQLLDTEIVGFRSTTGSVTQCSVATMCNTGMLRPLEVVNVTVTVSHVGSVGVPGSDLPLISFLGVVIALVAWLYPIVYKRLLPLLDVTM